MQKYKVGVIGATGMVGQRFVSMLANHPWFDLTVLSASSRSAGQQYGSAVKDRWLMPHPLPLNIANIKLLDAVKDAKMIADSVDFVFSAVDLPDSEIREFEDMYASLECPVVSNNSAHRWTADVPMVIPEINPEHLEIIPYQRKRLGTTRGFVAVKSNCSLQSYVPVLHPLRDFGLQKVLVCTYQAISGAGKNFESWPEMLDNVIPYIGGEEEKSQTEPLKVFGQIKDGVIKNERDMDFTAQCIRVPVLNGHMAAVFAKFKTKPDLDEVISRWQNFRGLPQTLNLPTAPRQYIHYFTEQNYPQTHLHRDLEGGMAVSAGRLRPDTQYDLKFVSLSHNTIRGAAGGAVLLAELLCAQNYITRK